MPAASDQRSETQNAPRPQAVALAENRPRGRVVCSVADLAGLDARRARVQAFGCATHARTHGLDVGIPAAGGAAVRVRDTFTEPGSLAANVADGSHGNSIHAFGSVHWRTRARATREVQKIRLTLRADRASVHDDRNRSQLHGTLLPREAVVTGAPRSDTPVGRRPHASAGTSVPPVFDSQATTAPRHYTPAASPAWPRPVTNSAPDKP